VILTAGTSGNRADAAVDASASSEQTAGLLEVFLPACSSAEQNVADKAHHVANPRLTGRPGQGQRTLSVYSRKDFRQEVGGPTRALPLAA
jgi:hypothetical protein